MKCPLKHTLVEATGVQRTWVDEDCLKEECAWWLEDVNMCAVRDLALELTYTQFRLTNIKDMMPRSWQFTK